MFPIKVSFWFVMWLLNAMVIWFYGWSPFTCRQVWGPKVLLKRRYYVLNFSCDLRRLGSQRAMWLHGWLPVTIFHHPAKSDGITLGEEEILIFQFDKWRLVIMWSESCKFIMDLPQDNMSVPCKVWWSYIFRRKKISRF